jgi:TPR repeat protein
MLAVAGCSSDKPVPMLPVGAEDLALQKGMVFSQMPRAEELPVYKAAAYAGSGEAANALATFYMKADKSGQLQFYWTLVAAENGDPVGQYNAGLSYLDPAQDRYAPGRARFWLEKAASQGETQAKDRLSELLRK